MRTFFSKSNLGGLILAALAAGVCSSPAVARTHHKQSESTPAQKKTGSLSAHSTTSSSAASKKTTPTGTKSTNSSATKKSTSAHSKSRRRTKKVKGQQTPTPDRINEIQQALASKGVFAGEPTGKWDDSTVDAMKKFQASQGLAPSGKLDALTLQKLGLGSQTAGVAAPTPPPNSINRLRNAPSALEEPPNSDEPHN